MKILVCVKGVCDPAEYEKKEPADETELDGLALRLNRFDEYAVEEAIRIREQIEKTRVYVLSAGPPETISVIRRAIGMGADSGIYIDLDGGPLFSPETTAAVIAKAAAGKNYDLIITGAMSEDRMSRQTGRMIAAFLGYPCATSVIYESIDPETKTITVKQEHQGGRRTLLKLDLPAVITVQTGINTPRYPSLSRMLAAKEAEIEIISSKDVRCEGPASRIIGLSDPRQSRAGIVLSGSTKEKAKALVKHLKRKAIL